jgi:predicted DsbA family dithiol-disulfide isomerase
VISPPASLAPGGAARGRRRERGSPVSRLSAPGVPPVRQNRGVSDIVRMRVYYDFASTLCYVAHCVLSSVEEEIDDLGVELEWRPIDLTMAAPWSRGDSFTPEVRTAVRNTGIALGVADAEMPDPWLDSRPASHVALHTTTASAEARWRRAVFDTIFKRRTPHLTPELRALARELTGLESLPDESQGFPQVEASTLEALALGVTGVPTILLDTWMFGGVYDGESMVSILRQLSEQYRGLGTSAVN